jgi:hypothetical protein
MKQTVINKLNGYGRWMSDSNGMGFKDFINNYMKNFMTQKDVNHKYQVPLKILYDMGIGREKGGRHIGHAEGVYTLDRLKNSQLVYDEDDNWVPINKLNTNYTALAHLVVEILEKEGKLEGFVKFMEGKTDDEIQDMLKSKKNYFFKKVGEHFKSVSDFDNVLEPIKRSSGIGERAENNVRETLEKAGFTTKYQGGDGDLIDMIFGIDLIMEKTGKTYLIQIKNNPAHIDITNGYYEFITLFVNPVTNYVVKGGRKTYTYSGIRIVQRNGNEHFLDKEGKLIK